MLRLICHSCRDAHDSHCDTISLSCSVLVALVGQEAASAVASACFHALAGRGCRPSKIKVDLGMSPSMPEETLLSILLNPLVASAARLHLRSGADGVLPGAAGASRVAAAMPLLSGLHIQTQFQEPSGVGTEVRRGPVPAATAAQSALLRALGPNLRALHLDVHLVHLRLSTGLGSGPAPRRQPSAAAALLLPDDLAACCPVLDQLKLRVQLQAASPSVEPEPGSGDDGGGLRQPALAATAAAEAAEHFVRTVNTVANLASLTSLELRFPHLALHPAAAVAAAALSSLAALSRLTRLALPIRASADPDAAEASGPPKATHVMYGEAVHLLLSLRRRYCRTAPPQAPMAPPPAMQQQELEELDLGSDLALTLPYLPYPATALTTLRVGELSAENVSASQWCVVPEPPPLLPLELWGRAAHDAGGGGGGDGAGGVEGGEGGRPRCSLPLCAVRLPPRLTRLQVRYMPDVAILAALAGLPYFASLDCTAARHPQGEICLDIASVGVAGPPNLGGGGYGRPGAAAGGGGKDSAAATALAGMVAAAAGLLLRVLDQDDWRRHPLTLRPSPFSFLRDGYAQLRWGGPHAAWMAALAPLATRVTRLRVKQMALRRADMLTAAAALPGLQSLELVRCAARRSDVRAWRAALGAGAVLRFCGDGAEPPSVSFEEDDMFASSSSSDCSDGRVDSGSDSDGEGGPGPGRCQP